LPRKTRKTTKEDGNGRKEIRNLKTEIRNTRRGGDSKTAKGNSVPACNSCPNCSKMPSAPWQLCERLIPVPSCLLPRRRRRKQKIECPLFNRNAEERERCIAFA
jgi:hypothetical protein